MRLLLDRYRSPLGPILLVTDSAGTLRALDFADFEPRMRRLLRLHYGDFTLEKGAAPKSVVRALDAYFDGKIKALDEIEVATGGTAFQRKVWQALRAIPAGATRSYGNIATRLRRSSACRAVGAANGANPIAIVVPCHRVVGSSGKLTGYAGGLRRKQWLLDHERCHCAAGEEKQRELALSVSSSFEGILVTRTVAEKRAAFRAPPMENN